jgi:transposase
MINLQIPLDIPEVEILKVEQSKVGDLIITVKSTKTSTKCRKCNKEIDKIHGYGETILLRHLPILDQPVYIRIKPTRYECINCDDHPTTTKQENWYRRKSQMTDAYEKYLMRLLISSTLQDVARKEAQSYDQVKGALNRQIATKVNWNDYPTLELLGFDEIALKKGHKDYVVIVSTRINNTTKIMAILSDRKKETVKCFIKQIPNHLMIKIKTVCSDMYDGYINAAKEVLGKQVNIVIDRFHVAKNYRGCVDNLRKKELKRLKKELTDKEYKELKGAMWALRKKEVNLTEEEMMVLEYLFYYSPDLEKAYQLQKELTDIFNTNYNKTQAAKEIKKWMKKVTQSGIECFDKFKSTLNNYWNEILNYFHRKGRKNSGFIEGLNNKIKIIKRRCYGIFDVSSLYQRIYLDLEGYQLFVCR